MGTKKGQTRKTARRAYVSRWKNDADESKPTRQFNRKKRTGRIRIQNRIERGGDYGKLNKFGGFWTRSIRNMFRIFD